VLNGKKHREDGPAVQYWYENGQKESEYWYLNGKLHREDGPALQFEKCQYWFLNDIRYSRKEWIEELKKIGSPHYEEQKILLNTEKYNI
jgi:antitoxin component YwqK of YwqJK toxin-antitoxin module